LAASYIYEQPEYIKETEISYWRGPSIMDNSNKAQITARQTACHLSSVFNARDDSAPEYTVGSRAGNLRIIGLGFVGRF